LSRVAPSGAAVAASIVHDATQSVTQLMLKAGELGFDIYGERGTLTREDLP
jgi:hypothetical protein